MKNAVGDKREMLRAAHQAIAGELARRSRVPENFLREEKS